MFQEGGEAGREESPSNLSREESPGQKTGVRIARESRGKGVYEAGMGQYREPRRWGSHTLLACSKAWWPGANRSRA